jgi:hypothetical protein
MAGYAIGRIQLNSSAAGDLASQHRLITPRQSPPKQAAADFGLVTFSILTHIGFIVMSCSSNLAAAPANAARQWCASS